MVAYNFKQRFIAPIRCGHSSPSLRDLVHGN